jgi:hypothetical protein
MWEGLVIATGAKLGELVLNQVLDLGKGALGEYIQDFFKDCKVSSTSDPLLR